ncbi:MAG: RnfABCDGE type electron transport complex subunit D [Lentisphaeria bacterium]|jgi:Na+-transporting NADH:ubiquinone oxidoreductase subunit B|nr:RnfABCDGE type electron transport complex subunit D [Lentisphaeria bacterium]
MADPASKPKRKAPRFREQKMMRRVLLALLPALLGGIAFFGWRVLALVLWVALVAAATEYLLARRRGDPLTESCFVTAALLALSLPPTLPFWMAAVGAVVALSFGKELFGGFGRNVFNPAIVGRGFLYLCFPLEMTAGFAPVHQGFSGFLHWSPLRVWDGGVDAVTAVTPMWARRDYSHTVDFLRLFFGNIGERFEDADGVARVVSAGSIGEVSAVLLLLGGIYLLWTKTANWRLTASTLAGAVAATVVFRHLLGAEMVPPLAWTLCSGALLYASFFMVTDPVSAPRGNLAQWLYGAFIGVMIVFLRWRAAFAGGVAFAILLGNTLGPTLDLVCQPGGKKAKEGK